MSVAYETLEKLIDHQKFAYIGSVNGEGFPNVKAMLAPRKREGLKYFYFTTNTSSMRTKTFLTNPKACLYFADTRFYRGIMFTGTVEVLSDDAIKREIWRAGDTMYYALGVTDPDYSVLKFTAQTGRFYPMPGEPDFEIPEPESADAPKRRFGFSKK